MVTHTLICLFGCILQRVYVACARQIKRLDSVSKSPIYAFFSETLSGTSSIRAYGQQHRFISHSDMLLDNSQRVWFEAFSSNRSSLGFRFYILYFRYCDFLFTSAVAVLGSSGNMLDCGT